jgi:hypothetical protein
MPLVWLLLSLSVAAAKKIMEKGGKSSKHVSRLLLLIRYNSTKLRSRVCFYTFFLYKIGREQTEEGKGRVCCKDNISRKKHRRPLRMEFDTKDVLFTLKKNTGGEIFTRVNGLNIPDTSMEMYMYFGLR